MNARSENEMPPEGQKFKTITTATIITITTTTNTTSQSTVGNVCCSQYNNIDGPIKKQRCKLYTKDPATE